jgi:ACS family hexuronate transporter-like MFS transporter
MGVSAAQETRFAWLVVFLLFVASVLNYLDRTVLGVVMPQIRRDLSMSNADYGLAVNSFLVLYTIFYILGGRVADRLGYRRTFTITVIFWSIANMLHALAQGLRSLCIYRALLGMGEGGFYPTAMRAAAEWFPPKNRAKAVGVFLCGISIGTLIAPPFVAWLTIKYGWRSSFVVTGALGSLLVLPWLVLHRRITRSYGASEPVPAARVREHPGRRRCLTPGSAATPEILVRAGGARAY